jgi:putative redox protein
VVTVASATGEIGATHYSMSIQTGRHKVMADEPLEDGGTDSGPSPFGLVLSGLAACTAITLRMYADHKEWSLTTVHVKVALRRRSGRISIDRELHLVGALDESQRARLAEIAEKTPVTRLIKSGTEIRTTFR